jgi:hypothetical protein
MIATGQSNIDVVLSQVSVLYGGEQNYIIDKVMPVCPSDTQFGLYPTFGTDHLVAGNDSRAGAALSNELKLSVSWGNEFYCDGHAKHSWVPDDAVTNEAASLNIQTAATKLLVENALLNREVSGVAQIASALTPIDLSGSSYAAAWNQPTVDPIAAILVQKETIAKAICVQPNYLAVSQPVWRAITLNPLVKARVSGALTGIDSTLILPKQIANLLGLKDVIVSDAVQKPTAGGPGVAGSYIWGMNALLYYAPPAPSLLSPALGYLITWMKGLLGSLVFSEHSMRRHAMWIEAMRYYAPVIISPYAGVMWSNASSS